MRILMVFIIGMFFSFCTFGQRCATVYSSDKYTDSKVEEIERFLKISTKTTKISGAIYIPTVIHIVYNSSSQNISIDQIKSQICILNKDYSRQNSDRNLTPEEFLDEASNPNIQFFLAQTDPNGNPTNGITRTNTSKTSFTSNDEVKFSSTGGKSAWPTNKYLNIWVCNLSGGLLGYAQFPWDYSNKPETDGIVVDYESFGNQGTAEPPFDLGRTCTHEIGHWLGLIHIWGDDNGSCDGSDNVYDTPNQADHYGGFCPTGAKSSCDSHDMYMNYMDYTNDACMNLFTAGQRNVMRNNFNSGEYRDNFDILNPFISGSTPLCNSSNTYTLQKFPSGNSVTWSATPSHLFTNNDDTSSTFITAWDGTGVGTGTITATLTGDCGSVAITKNIWVGRPQFTITGTDELYPKAIGFAALCEYGTTNPIMVGGENDPGITNVQWSYSGPLDYITGETGINYRAKYAAGLTSGQGLIYADATNACGSVENNMYYSVEGWLRLFPNPTEGTLYVEIDGTQFDKLPDNSRCTLSIFDKQMHLRKRKHFTGYSTSVDVNHLPPDVYIVRVKAGEKTIETKIMVK